MNRRTLPSEVARLASRFYEGLEKSPLIQGLEKALKDGEWDVISDVNPDPRQYSCAKQYFADAAAAGLLRKFQGLPTTHDRRQNAIEKWWEGERACYKANLRLAPYLPENRNSADQVPGIAEFLSEVRKLIKDWLGSRPDDLAIGRFGPGTTFSDRSGRSTVPDKMSSDPVMTRNAWPFLPQWMGTAWGAAQAARSAEIKTVPGNRYSTVPKTAKTDRSIAAEPSINLFYQLALGAQLKSRLRKRANWDMTRAQELHRLVAERSSVTKEFATLDLSNASDTVCKNLVKILLPPHWFDQLDALRSPRTLGVKAKADITVAGSDGWVLLEKFSSMGNGFTFELETIIFAAVAVVATRRCGYGGWLGRDVYVFGDDIIVKDDVAKPLKPVLEFLGFTLNAEKSYFGEVPFRESCGGDYFDGLNVRPYFLGDQNLGVRGPSGETGYDLEEPQDYVAAANGIYALGQRLAFAGLARPLRAWFTLLDCLPSQVRRCRGPQALGDIVITDEDEEKYQFRWRSGIRYIRVYRPHRYRKVAYACFEPDIVLACATYGLGGSNGGPKSGRQVAGVVPRDGLLGYKVGWVPWS